MSCLLKKQVTYSMFRIFFLAKFFNIFYHFLSHNYTHTGYIKRYIISWRELVS